MTHTLIETCKQYRSEMHRPYSIIDGFESERLAYQHLADEDKAAAPAQAAVDADSEDSEMPGIADLGFALGIGARGGPIECCRHRTVECPMWPFLVIETPEALEALLLCSEVGRRRTRGLGFEGAMHALVPAVLLRAPWLDAHGMDAEFDPPHGQTREPADGAAGKRRTVVGEDLARQPVFAEHRHEAGTRPKVSRGMPPPAGQQITRAPIGDRQRIAIAVITGEKFPLEVRRPHITSLGARISTYGRPGWRCRARRLRGATSP